MSNRLSDEDVDRIAGRIVGKLVIYALTIAAAVFLAPIVIFGVLSLVSAGTRELPFLALPLATLVLAGPIVVLIWLYGRSKRAR